MIFAFKRVRCSYYHLTLPFPWRVSEIAILKAAGSLFLHRAEYVFCTQEQATDSREGGDDGCAEVVPPTLHPAYVMSLLHRYISSVPLLVPQYTHFDCQFSLRMYPFL